jgi:hypothetical protein
MRRPARTASLVMVGVLAVTVASAGLAWASGRPDKTDRSRSGPVPQVVAPAKADTVFVPLPGCRLADTRSGGGAISHGTSRVFHVTGSCGVPASASSVTLSLTTVNETAGGNLTVFATGTTRPLATALSFARSSIVTSSTVSPVGSGGKVSVYVGGTGSTQLILDVTGYTEPQVEGLLNTDGSLFSATSRVVGSHRNSAGAYVVTVDTDVTNCSATATTVGAAAYAAAETVPGNTVHIDTWTLDPATHAAVPTDEFVNFTVVC